MSKAQFTEKEQQVWENIHGSQGKGLTTWQQENIVRDLETDFGLVPSYISLGGKPVEYTSEVFRRNVNTRDGFCIAYYHPRDCAVITGTSPDNWSHWARLLFGKKSSVHSPRLTLPHEMYQELREKGYAKMDGPRRPHRFLSVTMVAFYIAAQADAWETPQQIHMLTDMKKMLTRHRLQVIDLVMKDDGVEKVLSATPKPDILGAVPAPVVPHSGAVVADLLEKEIADRRARVQEARDNLLVPLDDEVSTPVAAQAPEASLQDILGDAGMEEVQTGSDRLQAALVDETPELPSALDISQMDAAELQDMMAAMAAELKKREQASLEDYCSRALIIEGEIDPLLRVYVTLTVRYPDGTCQDYQAQQDARVVGRVDDGLVLSLG